MYIGKILATYQHVSGKHRWLASATSQAKLSYVSVQLFIYQPHIPIAVGFHSKLPSSRIFVHLEMVHLHHLFPVTEGLNITEVGEGRCVSIPERLQPLLLVMSKALFLDHWDKEFKALAKKNKK
jgi:hypothetical protein